MPRNDDLSLILTKAKISGFLPDVKDSELDVLEAQAARLFQDDPMFSPVGVNKTTDITLALSDMSKVVSYSDGVDHTVIVPLASGAGIAAGTEVDILSSGIGRINLKPPAENLWPYPDGLAGSAGIWYGRVGNTSIVPGIGPNGGDVVRSTATGASSSGAFGHYSLTVPLSSMNLKPGDRISARMWISHVTPATNARFEIAFMSGTTQLSRPAQTPVNGVGVRNIVNLQIPVGCDGIQIYVLSTSASVGQTVDIDEVQISKVTTAIANYADGNDSGWYWWGTPHASPSSNGILLGERIVPKNGRLKLRHLGNDIWTTTVMGIPDTVLVEGTALNVDRDNGQGGLMGPARNMGSTTTALVSNTLYSDRIVPSRNMLIKNINFKVMTASGTDDPVDVAILDSTLTRLSSSGSTTGRLNSTGIKSVTIPDVMLQAGSVYYVSISGTSTASLLFAVVIGDAFGTAAPLAEGLSKAATFPIGTSVAGMAVANAVPFLWIKEA